MRLSLLLSLVLLSTLAYAQDISVQDTVSSISGDGLEPDIVAKNTIFNNTDLPDTLRWIRVVKDVSENWEAATCDNEVCWFPNVDSNQFVIPAQSTGNLDVHFYPEGNTGSGTVELLVYRPRDGRENGIIIEYTGQALTVGIEELLATSQVEVFPNPVVESLKVQFASESSHVIVSDAEGQAVYEGASSLRHEIPFNSLPKGTYFVRFEQNGKSYSHPVVVP